ncbi:MAG: PilN domain-containing protein [Rhizobiaceae bacterium]
MPVGAGRSQNRFFRHKTCIRWVPSEPPAWWIRREPDTMGLREGLTDLYGWWRAELAGMKPARLRGRARAPVSANLTVRRDGIIVEPADRSSKIEPVIAADAQSAVSHLRQKFFRIRIGRPGVRLVVGSDRYLKRQLSPLRLPHSKLSAMARLDMQASTPFSPQDAYLACIPGDEKNPASGYAVVKKTILKPLLDELSAAGIAVRQLSFENDGGGFEPDERSFRTMVPLSRWRVFSGRLQTVGVAACLLGVAATIGHAHWRYYRADTELENAIAQAENGAAMVRALIAARNMKINQIAAIRAEKRGAVPLVSILEEMSRVIPDTTWLTDIQINGDRVVFSGFSTSAAALIPLLEESRLFQAPTFRTPVVRVANRDGERFTIGMDVETDGG